jgi:hypothetical protein
MKKQLKFSGGIKLTVAGALLGLLSIVSSSAQTYNVVTVANFALTGVRQNGDTATPVRIGNKEIIAALNATGQFNFGSGAKIVMISLEDQLPTFGVREGSGKDVVTTDIQNYFRVVESDEIHSANNLTSYVIQDYEFDNHSGTSFSVSGLSTLKRGSISGPGFGPLERVKQINSQVNGPGSMNGDDALYRGSMSAGSPKAEVAG